MEMSEGTETSKCCSSDCINHIPLREKEKFRNTYKKLCKTLDSRLIFIIANVSELPVAGAKRQCARSYRVGAYPVCFKTFCKLLGISSSVVKRAFMKMKAGNLEDARGGGHNRLSEHKIASIKNHINTFPRRLPEPGEDPAMALQYIDPELNLKQMHREFKRVWAQKNPGKAPAINSYR
jgi:hypothetical protein